MMGLLQQILPFLQTQDIGGGLKIPAGSTEVALRLPTYPATEAGMANLKATADAMTAPKAATPATINPQNLAMALMQSGAPQVAQMMPMSAIPMGSMQPQQYGPAAALQMQQANDELMRQRMQGLLAMIGGR